jgi:hypothetical protein
VRARFLTDIARNPNNAAILRRWHRLDLPDLWLVAGCLFQTVWNLQLGRPPSSGIKDYDLFYFDAVDRSAESERQAGERVKEVLSDLGLTVEVVNQARVHQWYERDFGYPYPQLHSAEEGIRRFLVLETCVGVRADDCIAPYGLDGIYEGTLSPNPLVPHKNVFSAKIASYCSRWPHLVASGV